MTTARDYNSRVVHLVLSQTIAGHCDGLSTFLLVSGATTASIRHLQRPILGIRAPQTLQTRDEQLNWLAPTPMAEHMRFLVRSFGNAPTIFLSTVTVIVLRFLVLY